MEKRHYEILFICRHIQDDKANEFSEKYLSLVKKEGDVVRFENWGVRPLAYTIDGFRRGLYVLINIHCPPSVIAEMEKLFKFDDMILRYMVIRCKDSSTEESPIMKIKQSELSSKSSMDSANEEDAAPAVKTETSNETSKVVASTDASPSDVEDVPEDKGMDAAATDDTKDATESEATDDTKDTEDK